MQALLSYDQSPPITAPFRFFLTAPIFGVLAGFLLVWTGPTAFMSRWTPEALALTHLLTAGFMLQVMLGALIQVLPVVAGANIRQPQRVAALVHVAITLGALLLSGAFLSFAPWMFVLASLCFIGGGVLFVGASAWAMCGVPATGPTVGGLKAAVSGLAITVFLGVLMALGLAGWADVPLMQLADIHLGWGFLVWGLGLLAAVAYVVVPMFQITPNYPGWMTRWFVAAVVVAVCAWTAATFAGIDQAALSVGLALAVAVALFAAITLSLQRRSKRSRFDANQHCWLAGMASILSAATVWVVANVVPAAGEWTNWPILCGVVLIHGGFVSVITGMLYKIVPFLVWLHLQNLGQGVLMAPNMKKIIDEASTHRQMLSHLAAGAILIAAVFWPEWLAVPSGVALAFSQAWLARNLSAAVRVFRDHRQRIEEKRARQ